MTLVTGSIGLGIRERLPIADLALYSRESIQIWKDDLPIANLGETSRRVYHRLLESNTQLLNTDVRARLLTSLEEPVEFICNSLKKHYTGQSVSLSDKQRKVSNLSQALELEVAIGYKTIIEDLLNDEKYTSKLLPIAVNHVLYYFHNIQIRSYQLYRELAVGLWHEIHILYQLAEQNQFHETIITLGNKSLKVITTYKKILLLATTNPNQLRQSNIEMIAKSLSTISRYCTLSSDPEIDYDYVINLNSDAPPFHKALVKDRIKAHYRGINVSNIVTFLQQELKTAELQKRKIAIDDPTLRHLLRAWGTMATRAFTRTDSSCSIQVSIGLSACHYLISRELFGEAEAPHQTPTGQSLVDSLEGSLKDAMILNDEDSSLIRAPKASHPDWNTRKDGPIVKANYLWDSVYRKKSSIDIVDDSKPFEFMVKAAANKTAKYNYHDAIIINVSPGGYSIKLDGTLPKQTQTGEIIGILEQDGEGETNWNIGNIRWMKNHKTDELQVGVQLIAPNALPVLAQIRTSHTDNNSFQRCLLLPAIVGIGQPPTILTSTIPFSINHKVRIKKNEEVLDVRLVKLLSSGHSYQQFEYEKLQVDISDEKKPLSGDDFDSVWDML